MTSRLSDVDLDLLLLIRHFELTLLDLFSKGELNGTTHSCLGQEYIPVALGPLLCDDDFVFSNHRGHGHYLARYRDPAGLLAEIMGREGALCSGVGGSQHLYRHGYLSTGVQGESVPVGAGVALQFRRAARGQLAVVFIGDGTWGEGAVYEALNIASLWSLPLLLVVENNGIAQSTPIERNLAGTIGGRAAAFGIGFRHLSTTDLGVIRTELGPAIAAMRHTPAPLIVEFDTVRIGAHSKGDDTREASVLAAVRRRDWHSGYQTEHPEQFAAATTRQQQLVAEVVADVRQRPLATRNRGPR